MFILISKNHIVNSILSIFHIIIIIATNIVNLVHPIFLVLQLIIILFTSESTMKNKVNAIYLVKIG
jgi:hypothetical protein